MTFPQVKQRTGIIILEACFDAGRRRTSEENAELNFKKKQVEVGTFILPATLRTSIS
jgi:hypothetical protein